MVKTKFPKYFYAWICNKDAYSQGDHQWAKWLLFSRIKGHEYDASFFNARALLVRDVVSDGSLPVLEANEIISTVDDIAEAGWLMAALATLMFAPLPIQSCLSSGSVKRSCNSFQCTLENLRPALQKFPTLWRTLVASCLGHDTTQSFWGLKGRNGKSLLSFLGSWSLFVQFLSINNYLEIQLYRRISTGGIVSFILLVTILHLCKCCLPGFRKVCGD